MHDPLVTLEKLPPYGPLFLAPAEGCSIRLQRWGPSGPKIGPSSPPKNVQNPFGNFAEIHLENFAEICLNYFAEIHLEKFAEI